MNDEKVVVYQTKKGVFLYVLGAVVMSLLSLLAALLDAEMIKGLLYRLPVVNFFTITSGYVIAFRAFMLFGAFFFGICLFFIVRRAKSKEILLVDERGITDNSSAIALGFIPWHDIGSICLRPFMGQTFIEAELKNEEKYLANLGKVKRNAIRANKKTGFQAVLINLNGSGEKAEVVYPKVDALFNQYRVKH